MTRDTHIEDLMSGELLARMVAEGYIRVKAHPTLPLFIYNYAEKAMFEKNWNAATLQCRGLITTEEGFIVARPWEKFFNYGEKPVLIASNDPVEITDKCDGSLGIGYPTPEGWAIATRGSFMSEQAVWATEWIQRHLMWLDKPGGYTPLFEIVGNWNRIVLDYGDFEGLILLGCIDTQMGYVYGPNEARGLLDWRGESTKVFAQKTMAEFISSDNANRPNAEGVVVRTGWRMVKIKQDDYVQAHAIVTNLSNRGVWQGLASGAGIPEQAAFMPDEFYSWLVTTAGMLNLQYIKYKNRCIDRYQSIQRKLGEGGRNRKTFASYVLRQEPELKAEMFKLFDGQDITELCWKAVKPETFERPFSRSEDNA